MQPVEPGVRVEAKGKAALTKPPYQMEAGVQRDTCPTRNMGCRQRLVETDQNPLPFLALDEPMIGCLKIHLVGICGSGHLVSSQWENRSYTASEMKSEGQYL